MTLNDYKNLFEQQLNGLYDEEERKALLAVVMDEVLNYSRADMVLKKYEELLPDVQTRLTEVVTQLQNEIPVQYIIEKAYFYGYEFKVSPATLIPRRETE